MRSTLLSGHSLQSIVTRGCWFEYCCMSIITEESRWIRDWLVSNDQKGERRRVPDSYKLTSYWNWTNRHLYNSTQNKDVTYYILIYLSLTYIEKDKKYGVITDENFTRFPGIFNTCAHQTTTNILNNNQSKFMKIIDLKKDCCTTFSFLTKNWGQHLHVYF